jgi:hypothetical protein
MSTSTSTTTTSTTAATSSSAPAPAPAPAPAIRPRGRPRKAPARPLAAIEIEPPVASRARRPVTRKAFDDEFISWDHIVGNKRRKRIDHTHSEDGESASSTVDGGNHEDHFHDDDYDDDEDSIGSENDDGIVHEDDDDPDSFLPYIDE